EGHALLFSEFEALSLAGAFITLTVRFVTACCGGPRGVTGPVHRVFLLPQYIIHRREVGQRTESCLQGK
ncbi:MAG TPA: hypothetical protein VHF46_03155, partial [Rubrobacteraceae bacterium]|nr:hypothetical protein [Rubrobacteraceae bacterium]